MATMTLQDGVEIIRTIHHYKGKHIRAVLEGLEERGVCDPSVRKLVLDNFNEYARTILTRLGHTLEV
jgi:hypothetical protein